MTTAHRPTWYNAIGGENQGGNRKVSETTKVCSKDLPGHLKMKTRDLSDYVSDKNIIKENLLKLENNKSNKLRAIENIKNLTNQEYKNPFPEDEDDEVEEEFLTYSRSRKRRKAKKGSHPKNKTKGNMSRKKRGEDDNDLEEKSDEEEESEEEYSESSSSSYSESETDEEERELLRELENLKKEKLEKEKKEKEEQEKLKKKTNNVLTNNPLINLADSDEEISTQNSSKRKWTDDAIFRNTTERDDKKKKLTFVNDSVRSTFHKKFLIKYIH